MPSFAKALEIKPDSAIIHNNLATALGQSGRFDEAIIHFRRALEIQPDYAEAHNNLGMALADHGQADEAAVQYQKALEIKPDYAEARNNLANVLLGGGRFDEAIAHYRKALAVRPGYPAARRNLNVTLFQRKMVLDQLTERRKLLGLRPNDVALLNDTAWLLATNPNASVRNGAEAVELARRVARLAGGREPAVLGTLAAAYAEVGRFPEAVQTARKALELATQQNKQALARSIQAKLSALRSGDSLSGTATAVARATRHAIARIPHRTYRPERVGLRFQSLEIIMVRSDTAFAGTASFSGLPRMSFEPSGHGSRAKK